MKLDNKTPWPARFLNGSTGEEEMVGIVACKCTYRLKNGALEPVKPDEMWSVITAPIEFRGTLLNAETDFRKQGVDLIVFGQACAPGGKPAPRVRLEVECGPTAYKVDAIGDRQWIKNGKKISISEPAPFTTMPITNDRAFGGKVINNGNDGQHAVNPDGRGLVVSLDNLHGAPLPNLERADALIQNWTDNPIPACFYKPMGPLPDTADQFNVLAASPDKFALPKALAFRGFNNAPPALVIPQGQVGKTLRLAGFDPAGDVIFPLPVATAIPGKQGPVAHVNVGNLRSRFPLSISTIVAFVPERMLVVTYLGLFRYLFRPIELRTSELHWYGEQNVPAIRGATGDAATRNPNSVSTIEAIPSRQSTPPAVSLPAPITEKPIPKPPAPPPPSPIQVVKGVIDEKPRLTVLLKRTYSFAPGQLPAASKDQQPLYTANNFHAPINGNKESSVSTVVEAIAYKSGTDVVIRGHARPPEPVTTAMVGVAVGALKHQATVFGKRSLDLVNGRLFFTPPEKFSAMPLRYENAYGGSDPAFDDSALDDLDKIMKPNEARRCRPLFRELYDKKVPPFVYPRNRCGKGYILHPDPKKSVGRELPNIELTTSRLTPERILLKNPRDWHLMPIPAGFDFLDPHTFPRSAMMGFPPLTNASLSSLSEVSIGQVPSDYARGNIFETEREKIPALIHPDVGRAAPIGLRAPFLNGNETITLTGMDPKNPKLQITLPNERPSITVTVRDKPHTPRADLYQVFIDVDQKILTLVWGASFPLETPLNYGEETKIQQTAQVAIHSSDYVAPEASSKRGILSWFSKKG